MAPEGILESRQFYEQDCRVGGGDAKPEWSISPDGFLSIDRRDKSLLSSSRNAK